MATFVHRPGELLVGMQLLSFTYGYRKVEFTEAMEAPDVWESGLCELFVSAQLSALKLKFRP